jgi:preprotein translocase subunit SecB
MTENTTEQNTLGDSAQLAFSMQKVYVKDLSFEAPGVPEVFNFEGGYKPNVNLELNTSNRLVNGDSYEVSLNITVTAKEEENVMFLAEVKQCGVFLLQNMDEATKRHTLGSFCPSILFPYARQVISEMISNGGFPQLLLAHINFEQLFKAQEERRASEADGAAPAVASPTESSH